MLGASQGERSIPDAGVIPQITVNGEEAYSMFAQSALPQNTPFHRAESYEDAGMEALLYAGYPFDGLGLQKKYGVSDDFARVITQQAICPILKVGRLIRATEVSARVISRIFYRRLKIKRRKSILYCFRLKARLSGFRGDFTALKRLP